METSNTPLLDFAEGQIQNDRAAVNAKTYQRPHAGNACCGECGAPTLEYKHTLSKVLADSLIRLYRFTQARKLDSATVADLMLSYSHASNFQKLRYWGLVEHRTKDDKRTGRWAITQAGEDWVRCTSRLQRFAWTYRGKFVEFEGDPILITDVVPNFNWRIDWAEEARPHDAAQAA